MNGGQYEGLMARLGEILDRMPERPTPAASEPTMPVHAGPCWSDCKRPEHRGDRPPVPGVPEKAHGALVSSVLYSLLVNLNGWIEGAHSNHEASGHRGENLGEECWTQFSPSDIRNMINDVAREFGVGEFPKPERGKEDEYR